MTPENAILQRRIAAIQGSQGLWVTGMYAVDVDNHESALLSGLVPALALARAIREPGAAPRAHVPRDAAPTDSKSCRSRSRASRRSSPRARSPTSRRIRPDRGSEMFARLARLIYRRRVLTLVASSLFLALSIAMVVRGGTLTAGTFDGTEAGSDRAARGNRWSARRAPHDGRSHLPQRHGRPSQRGIPDGDEDRARAAPRRSRRPLRRDPRRRPTGPRPQPGERSSQERPRAPQPEGRVPDERSPATPRSALASAPPTSVITCTGKVPFAARTSTACSNRDLVRAELVSLPLALLVYCLLVFRTVVAAALPVGVGPSPWSAGSPS